MKTSYGLLALNFALFGFPGCNTDSAYIGRDSSAQGGASTGSSVSSAKGGATASGGGAATKSGGSSTIGDATASGGAATGSGGSSAMAGATASGSGSTTGGATASGGAQPATGGSGLGGQSNTVFPVTGGSGNACRVPEVGQGPFATKLRFTNMGTTPLWLWQGCRLEFDVTSCDDGHSAPLPIAAGCMAECGPEAKPPCIACGACFSGSELVPAGGFVDYDWAGVTFSVEPSTSGCDCYRRQLAPSGLYRVTVPVWTSDPNTIDSSSIRPQPAYRVAKDFALAEAGITTTIDLKASACTAGADYTCNDLLEVSSLWGKCLIGGTCQCNDGFVINPKTGRCMIPIVD